MRITIKGSPRELAELAKALNGDEIAAEKRAEIPPLLTELSDVEETIKRNREVIAALREMNKVVNQGKENAPQAGAAEQDIPLVHFKPKFEEWIKIAKEANSDE